MYASVVVDVCSDLASMYKTVFPFPQRFNSMHLFACFKSIYWHVNTIYDVLRNINFQRLVNLETLYAMAPPSSFSSSTYIVELLLHLFLYNIQSWNCIRNCYFEFLRILLRADVTSSLCWLMLAVMIKLIMANICLPNRYYSIIVLNTIELI